MRKIDYSILILCALTSTMQGVWLADLIKIFSYVYIIPRIIVQRKHKKIGLIVASVFIIYALFDYVHGLEKEINNNWMSFIKAAIFSVFAANILGIREKNKILNFNYLLLAICSLILFQILTDFGLAYKNYREGLRLTPLASDPNFFSIFIYEFVVNAISKNMYLISILTIYLLLGSKTLLLILTASWLALNYKKGLLFLTLALTGLLIITITYPEKSGIGRTINDLIVGNYVFQRSYMWDKFSTLINTTPLLGNGHGYSKDILGTYMHNDYMETMVSFGVLGLVLLLIQKIIIFIHVKKIKFIAFLAIFVIPIMFSVNANEFYIFMVMALIFNKNIHSDYLKPKNIRLEKTNNMYER